MLLLGSTPAGAQVRPLYTPGINPTNSGLMPDPGFTYANVFQDYSFNQLKGPKGERLTVNVNGNVTVLVDNNIIEWVSKKKIFGANFAVLADLPFAKGALSLASFGNPDGGKGFADSYYQPATLGWHLKRADIQTAYGFTAPTGRFSPNATNNTGSGYWGQMPSAGQSFYLTKDKGTAFSAYETYEFHGKQRDTGIRAGQALSIDYSLTQVIPLEKNWKKPPEDFKRLLQAGLVGYGQWQTTDKTGPQVIPLLASQHYRVDALGLTAQVIWPKKKVLVGVSYFKEFGARSTVQGHSLQIVGGITF